jgi:transcriptional regulator with XRE-family HTH domain
MKNEQQRFLEQLGREIRSMRESDGLTQKELAEDCDMYSTRISRIECGHVMPNAYTLAKILLALGCVDNSEAATLAVVRNEISLEKSRIEKSTDTIERVDDVCEQNRRRDL